MPLSWTKAARELSIGVGSVALIFLAVFWPSLVLAELVFAGLGAGILIWVATAPIGDLEFRSSRSSLLILSGLVGAALVSVGLFTRTLRPMMLVMVAIFSAGSTVWITRIARR